MHEKMFESRLYFVDKLIGMGAGIILCDPHRAVIVGPSPLYGQELSSPDIRAGMALLIAALAARGTSTIANVGQIDRGYQDIDVKLKSLGAEIKRVKVGWRTQRARLDGGTRLHSSEPSVARGKAGLDARVHRS